MQSSVIAEMAGSAHGFEVLWRAVRGGVIQVGDSQNKSGRFARFGFVFLPLKAVVPPIKMWLILLEKPHLKIPPINSRLTTWPATFLAGPIGAFFDRQRDRVPVVGVKLTVH